MVFKTLFQVNKRKKKMKRMTMTLKEQVNNKCLKDIFILCVRHKMEIKANGFKEIHS